MTLEEFGKRLGVTKVAISNIEKGHRKVTTQMKRAICREYSVNETWLSFGTGKMFLADEVDRLDIFDKYLNSVGFTVSENVSEWHYENPNEADRAERIPIPDKVEYVLSKDGKSVIFTPEEFEELQNRTRETIEGIFYKKLAQSKK